MAESAAASTETPEIAKPTFKVYQHSAQFVDEPVYFQLVRMPDSAFVWIGQTGSLTNLALAMPSSSLGANSATMLINDSTDDAPCQLSRRLATRFKMPIYVSCDLVFEGDLAAFAERTLVTWLKDVFATAL